MTEEFIHERCVHCVQRLECLSTEMECPLVPDGLTSKNNVEFKVEESLVGREISFEHYGCPKKPDDEELAMFRVIKNDWELNILECMYCGERVLLYIIPSEDRRSL